MGKTKRNIVETENSTLTKWALPFRETKTNVYRLFARRPTGNSLTLAVVKHGGDMAKVWESTVSADM
jgi:hypothetical protein